MMKFIINRPRLFFSFATGALTFWLLPQWIALHTISRLIVGWNVAAILYLGLAAQMMMETDHEKCSSGPENKMRVNMLYL